MAITPATPTPMPRMLADDPNHWRQRAAEMRTLSETMNERADHAENCQRLRQARQACRNPDKQQVVASRRSPPPWSIESSDLSPPAVLANFGRTWLQAPQVPLRWTRKRSMPNFPHYPRSRHTSRARLATPITSLPGWPIASSAQADPNAKLARIAEAVDRLQKERKSVLAAAAAPTAAAPETTGTVPNSPSASAEGKILPNWILHGVRGRHALVENSHGDLFEITGDSSLPGLGRVEGIKRQDGQWVVVTARGLITSAP